MKRTILIVDDDEGVRQTLAEVLTLEGYNVEEASSGEEAIAVAMRKHVDSFLLDMVMPRMSGVEVCRAIRKLENYQTTPIIFVTGVEENWGLAEAFDAGADDLISKPPNIVILRARLKGHLQRMEYFQRLERARKVLQQYLSKRTLEVVETASATGTLPPPRRAGPRHLLHRYAWIHGLCRRDGTQPAVCACEFVSRGTGGYRPPAWRLR